MTIRETLLRARHALAAAGIPDPEVDAGWLMAHIMGIKRLEVLARGMEEAAPRDALAFDLLLNRRLAREPLQYILGETVFMGHRLLCRPPVLIPRNDTETLCLAALPRLAPGQRALDVCCGSGAIALSLKLARPACEVWASDLSPHALDLTADNARLHGVDITTLSSDLLSDIPGPPFDLICANPPYIPSAQLAGLQAEVSFEPRLALDGGQDGLTLYRRLIAQAPSHMKCGGWLVLEMGEGQTPAITALLAADFETPEVFEDHAGQPRVIAARLKGSHALTQ